MKLRFKALVPGVVLGFVAVLWFPSHVVRGGGQAAPRTQSLRMPNMVNSQSSPGALIANEFPGNDIGTQINNAIAALPKWGTDGQPYGTIVLKAATAAYPQTTTVRKPVRVTIDCSGGTLNYIPGSGAAVLLADDSKGSAGLYADGGLRNCVFEHGGIADEGVWAPNQATGLFFGGDPHGQLSQRDSNGYRQNVYNVRVMGFKYGMQLGNHAYMLNFTDCAFVHNGINIDDNLTSTVDSGENINFKGGRVTGSTEGPNIELDNNTYEWRFFGTSIDYPKSVSIAGNGINFQCFGCHLEQTNANFIATSGGRGHQIVLDGGTVMMTGRTGVDPSLFTLVGPDSHLIMNGVNFYLEHSVTAFVDNIRAPSSIVSMPSFSMQLGTEPKTLTTGTNGPTHVNGYMSYILSEKGNDGFSWSGVPTGGVHLTPGADSNRDVFYVSNAANSGVAFGINADGSVHGSVLRSTVATGTPPFQVNSRTPVANLTLLSPTQLPPGTLPLKGRTEPIGGYLRAGQCLTGKATGFSDLRSSMVFETSPASSPGDGVYWKAIYGDQMTAIVKVCAVVNTLASPTAYEVRAIP